ncbi:hypothetical protein OnM2_007006 [Erysiphe neolycopersici]|uniref:Uncharacterized protein n=1 Tax=Erysiphe neolycopersici TaxID=212602 RepID=A0A420I776_9PEZI|nr:hypothetical protein OnM2_007006 [Erysiphe neolycopersici]
MHFIKISIAILVCGTMAIPTQLTKDGSSLEVANGNSEKRDFNSTTELISKVKEHSVATNPSVNQTDTITSDSTTTMVGEINRESKVTSRAINFTKKLLKLEKSLPEKPSFGTLSIARVIKSIRFSKKHANNQNHIVTNNQPTKLLPKGRSMGWILQHL